MKIKTGVLSLIASLALLVSFADARGGGQQSTSPDQTTSGAQQQMDQQAMTQDPQTVTQIQEALTAQGYDPGATDGKWSSKTESALREFQQAKGMQATGQPDQQTLASLGVEGGAAAGGQQDMSSSPQSGAGGQSVPPDQQGGSRY